MHGSEGCAVIHLIHRLGPKDRSSRWWVFRGKRAGRVRTADVATSTGGWTPSRAEGGARSERRADSREMLGMDAMC